MKTHSKVEIGKHTVVKKAAPELMRIEVEKMRRAHEIGKESGLFRVPEVLDFDEVLGIAILERIRSIQPVIPKFIKSVSILEKIGASLAVIHNRLSLPSDMLIPLPQEFNMRGSEVFLHGDYNGNNIVVEDSMGQNIVILDWSMTPRYGGEATYGSRYFDLFWFINYMLWTPTFQYLFSDPVSKSSKDFLRAYFREAGIQYEPEMLYKYAKNFFEIQIGINEKKEDVPRRARYMMPRILVLIERFLESLKTTKGNQK
ncbi:MAG TPA: phosphotransferase [Smithellaceae bacterium]|nr:phosphotransferase [Smithellaceae bacterium]